ncbi:unnamed protein product [Rotaria sordida]|uniref:Cyclic nucleotide-binding domain-containing protein n=1 Tax=Rotaria sordida TaxID=392033 RepID=A0A815CVY0_9BILA|nr:unnamed protein product [Rotaria sordida]
MIFFFHKYVYKRFTGFIFILDITTNPEFNQTTVIEDYVSRLANIDIFIHLYRSKRVGLAHKLRQITFNPDRYIIAQGEQVNFFFIITSGQVVVSKKSSSDQEVVLKTLGQGDFFGALPMFFNIPSHVAVKARDPVTCMMMDRQSFQEMVAPELKSMERIAQA